MTTEAQAAAAVSPESQGEILEFNDIRKILPHGFPFLLVDRVTGFEPRRWIRGVKNLAAREPLLLPGGEPDFPPGLIVESIGQLAIILFGLTCENRSLPEILLGSISQVDVLARAPMGSQLQLEAQVVKLMDNSLIFNGRASIDGQDVLTLENLLAVTR
jgi:3-hydroxyacyl-[acyl-carrier-protein] dehydratase